MNQSDGCSQAGLKKNSSRFEIAAAEVHPTRRFHYNPNHSTSRKWQIKLWHNIGVIKKLIPAMVHTARTRVEGPRPHQTSGQRMRSRRRLEDIGSGHEQYPELFWGICPKVKCLPGSSINDTVRGVKGGQGYMPHNS